MSILAFLGSILSGGATGLLGVLLQRFFDYKAKEQDLKLVEINNLHALALADKELDKVRLQGQTAVAVADRDLEARTRESSDALAGTMAEADAHMFDASTKADRATFLTGAVLRSKSRLVLWTMALTDAFRGIIRPGLTAYLVVIAHMMYMKMETLLSQYGTQLDTKIVQDLTVQVITTLLYLATVAVTWWFGTRPPASQRK